MTRQEYEQKREQEWRAFCNRHGNLDRGHVIIISAFFDAFDRAFALGKQETNSSKNENTSNYSGNHFAYVLKMADTRLHIAAMVMAGALANKNVTIGCGDFEDNLEYITKTALMHADALIAECEKYEP